MHVVMAGDYPADPNKISGGVESVVCYLTQALQDYPDLQLDLITLGKRNTAERCVTHGRLNVHYLTTSKLPSYLSVLANIRRVRAKMLELKPDLIHVQVAGEYAEAAAYTGLPWILTLHGVRFLEVELWQSVLSKFYRGWFIKREEQRAVKRAKHVISISPFIQRTFNGQIQGRIYDIENPIDDAFFNVEQSSDPCRLLFVGRLIPRKGVHTLLQAFAHLHQRIPQATLYLAGGGSFSNEDKGYPQQLKEFVAENGLATAVTFLGELDKAALLEEYSRCSGLVLSSVVETAPMVIMEAMAAGKAIISTDAGGARYLVEHGKTGFIVPPNDADALGEALYQALKDETALREMGCQAREVAKQRFHASIVAAKTKEVYLKVLE